MVVTAAQVNNTSCGIAPYLGTIVTWPLCHTNIPHQELVLALISEAGELSESLVKNLLIPV